MCVASGARLLSRSERAGAHGAKLAALRACTSFAGLGCCRFARKNQKFPKGEKNER